MRVSRNNPLYKLALFWDEHDYRVPTNICPFIRHAIYGVAKWIFLTVLVLFVIAIVDAGLVGAVWTICYWVFDPFAMIEESLYIKLGTVFIAVSTGVSLLVTIILSAGAIKDWLDRRADKNKDHPPSVIAEYVRARHSKICVPIEFEG